MCVCIYIYKGQTVLHYCLRFSPTLSSQLSTLYSLLVVLQIELRAFGTTSSNLSFSGKCWTTNGGTHLRSCSPETSPLRIRTRPARYSTTTTKPSPTDSSLRRPPSSTTRASLSPLIFTPSTTHAPTTRTRPPRRRCCRLSRWPGRPPAGGPGLWWCRRARRWCRRRISRRELGWIWGAERISPPRTTSWTGCTRGGRDRRNPVWRTRRGVKPRAVMPISPTPSITTAATRSASSTPKPLQSSPPGWLSASANNVAGSRKLPKHPYSQRNFQLFNLIKNKINANQNSKQVEKNTFNCFNLFSTTLYLKSNVEMTKMSLKEWELNEWS